VVACVGAWCELERGSVMYDGIGRSEIKPWRRSNEPRDALRVEFWIIYLKLHLEILS
jgi:hypothetical protein